MGDFHIVIGNVLVWADEGGENVPPNPFREVPETPDKSPEARKSIQSSRTSVTNGQRHVQAKSGNLEIVIDDLNGKSITIKITDTVTNKETTYQAKDADDLKQQDAEAAALYERFTKLPAGIPTGFGVRPGFGLPPRLTPENREKAKASHDLIEECLDRVIEVQKELSSMTKETYDEKKVKELTEKLDSVKKDLFAIQAQLGVR